MVPSEDSYAESTSFMPFAILLSDPFLAEEREGVRVREKEIPFHQRTYAAFHMPKF